MWFIFWSKKLISKIILNDFLKTHISYKYSTDSQRSTGIGRVFVASETILSFIFYRKEIPIFIEVKYQRLGNDKKLLFCRFNFCRIKTQPSAIDILFSPRDLDFCRTKNLNNKLRFTFLSKSSPLPGAELGRRICSRKESLRQQFPAIFSTRLLQPLHELPD